MKGAEARRPSRPGPEEGEGPGPRRRRVRARLGVWAGREEAQAGGEHAHGARPDLGRTRLRTRGPGAAVGGQQDDRLRAGRGGPRESGRGRKDRKFRTAIEPLFLLIPSGPAAQLRH